MQLSPGTVAAWYTTDASPGTKRTPDERPTLMDKALDLLLMLLCGLTELLAQPTGLLTHGVDCSMTGTL